MLVLVGVRPVCSTQSPMDCVATRTSTRPPPYPTSTPCPYITPFGRQNSLGERAHTLTTGRPLALIRLANAAAQLVLRTQARRKEKGPPFPTSSALAPTDHPACCLASRLSLMPFSSRCSIACLATLLRSVSGLARKIEPVFLQRWLRPKDVTTHSTMTRAVVY